MNATSVIHSSLSRMSLQPSKVLGGILWILLVALSIGCQSDQTSRADLMPDYQLSKSSTLIFPLDNDTSPTVYIAQYYSDKSKELVFLLNKYINGCVVFDVKTGKQIRSIQIPREGPGSIAEVIGISIVGKDSLLFASKNFIYNSVLTNFSGEIISNNLFKTAQGKTETNPVAVSSAPVYLEKNSLHYVTYPIFSIEELMGPDRGYLWDHYYNLTDSMHYSKPITLPKKYHFSNWSLWSFILARVKGHQEYWVYNWPALDELVVLKEGAREAQLQTIRGLSNQIDIEPLPSGSRDNDIKQIVENKLYVKLFYDPYRYVYYRIARLPIRFDPIAHTSFYAFDHQPIEITVIDTSFQLIAKKELPGETYGIFSCFVGKEGLYMPKNNVHDPTFTEAELRFDLFTLEEKSVTPE